MLTYFLIGINSQYICEKYISAVIKKAYLKDRHIKCVICDFGDSSFISPVEEAVRELKKECPEIELCIVMPFLPLEDEYLELLDNGDRLLSVRIRFGERHAPQGRSGEA